MADEGADATASPRRVLEQRAVELARPLAEAGRRAGRELVHAEADGERFAIESRFVHAIARPGPITRIPGVPPVFLGIVQHGGEALPVVDVLALLGAGRTATVGLLVVIGEGRPDLALAATAVDRIDHAGELGPPAIEGPLALGVADGALVLDGSALLADPRLTVAADGP